MLRLRRRKQRRRAFSARKALGFVAIAIVAATLAAGARHVPRVLARMAVFELRTVRLEGATYLTEGDVRKAAGLTPESNIWESRQAWVDGLESHPLVRSARIRRIPPSTLAVRVEERVPVALAAGPLVEPVDPEGVRLPIDPGAAHLDLPILLVDPGDSTQALALKLAAAELRRLEEEAPDVFAVVSDVQYEDGEMVLRLGDALTRLRFLPPLSSVRLKEGMAAMNDWAARFDQGPPGEVDLRFDDQVLVRARSGP